jgi:hypothetical protein
MVTTTTYSSPQTAIDMLLGRASAVEIMAQRLAKGSADRDKLMEARQRYVSEAMQVEQAAFGTYRMPNEIRALVAGATPALAIDVPELTKWLCKNCGQSTRLHEFTDYCMGCVEEVSEPKFEPEPPVAITRKVPTVNELVIEVLNLYFFPIETKVEEELRRRGFAIGEFDYASSTRKRNAVASRIAAAWQIALSGNWKLPEYTGQPFIVGSQGTEAQYQVYCASIDGHRVNQCDCYDNTRHGDDLSGFCKHAIAVYLIFLACKALEADQPGKRTVAA